MIIEDLYQIITQRAHESPAESYTAQLLAKGRAKVAQKIGEEAVETIIAALAQSSDKVVAESADLLYHLLVLWVECGVTPQMVAAELEKRRSRSGLEEKNTRG